MAVNTFGQDISQAGGSVVPTAPASQTPVTPTPLPQTPATPTVNPAQNQALTTPTVPQQPPVTVNVGTSTTPKQTGAQTGQLAMPATGSVIDLLNTAGQDSSYTSRQQLAQQFGIQNYTGTATQNQELSKKYLDAYNALKGTTVPENTADARNAFTTYQEETPQISQEDPQATFFDAYAGMNPVVKNLYDQLNTILSSVGTRETFTEEFNRLRQEQNIEGLSTELMDINRVMDGTEDDLRDEISKAGGFATESQVQALKGARNKTLLKQAQSLSDQLEMRNDYIDQVIKLSGADREQVEKDIDRKLGITEKVVELQDKMDTAAKENYQNIIDIGEKRGINGYAYLAESLGGNSSALRTAEKTLGLPNGALSSIGFLSSVGQEEWSEPYKLGGSYVQKNSKTGEIRTAASIPNSDGGVSGPTSYQEWVLAGSPGTYASFLEERNVKVPTTAQQTVATYAARIEQANPTITNLENYISTLNPATFETQRVLPSYFQSSEYRQYDQAARNFINAVLRRESGAVISPSEFDNAYKQYLPRPNDDVETLKNKKMNRDIVFASLKKASGNAFQSVDELLGITPMSGTPKTGDTRLYEGYAYEFNGKEWELKK